MQYREFLPNSAIRAYVRYFWVLTDFTDYAMVKSFKIIPDGIPALLFQDTPTGVFYDSQGQFLPSLYLYGQAAKPREEFVKGPYRIIGAYLQPTALKTLFQIDAHEFTGQNIPLENIWNASILEQLINTNTVMEKIDIISTFLYQRIQQLKYRDQQAEFASTLLQSGKSLQEIQLAMHVSERTLERLVKEYIGLPPKTFSRIIRFQRSLDIMRQIDAKALTSLAYESNYFDQSHFIREFNAFTGTTPSSFLQHADEQLPNFPQWNV